MSKHTPGPWKVFENPEGLPVVESTGPHADAVAHIRWARREADGAEVDANARLIAAAPDLLEALRLAIQFVEKPKLVDALRDLPDGWAEPVSRDATLQAARAAIAKATGGK